MSALRTFALEFESQDWEQELEAFYHTDVEVPATVTVDGVRYPNVGVRFRGNSSYMMVPRGSKRSLNLSFDFVDTKQALYGYRSINLLNANGDPTFVRTSLFSHIANQYLPAPRANLSRVVINGEVWGVYVNVQQYNKDFLRDFYRTTDGARWKVPGSPFARGGLEYLGDSIEPYRKHYEIKTKNDSASWRALIRLTKVLNTTAAAQLEQAIAPLLDIDEALRFLALDNTLANSDGYWTRASDYNLYLDPKGRFHVLPHDMNEALVEEGPPPGMSGMPGMPGGSGMPGMPGMPGGPGPTLDPLIGLTDATKPLRSKLLAVPALCTKYLGYVRDMATTWLDWSRLQPLLSNWQSLIAADVATDTKKLGTTEAFRTGFEGAEGSLKAFVEARRNYLVNYVPKTP
jgi:spore coat protein CotH